jgi:hypothetical protein
MDVLEIKVSQLSLLERRHSGTVRLILFMLAYVICAANMVWYLDVYKAADEYNVTVVGGAARTVGVAGGWLLGGGHSPLGAKFGMGVDSRSTNKPDLAKTCCSSELSKQMEWS